MAILYMQQKETEKTRQNFFISNQKGREIYRVVGRWGRLEDRVLIYGRGDQELARAVQVVLSIFPKFEVCQAGEFVGNFTRQAFFNQAYFKLSHKDWWVINHEEGQAYTIKDRCRQLALIKKYSNSQGDVFVLNIAREEDQALVCLLTSLLNHYNPYRKGVPFTGRQVSQSDGFPFLYPSQYPNQEEKPKLQKSSTNDC